MTESTNSKLLAKDIKYIKDALAEIKDAVAEIKDEQKNFVTNKEHNALAQEIRSVETHSDTSIAALTASVDVVKSTMANNRLTDLLETQKINAKIAKFVGISLGGMGVLQFIALVNQLLNPQ